MEKVYFNIDVNNDLISAIDGSPISPVTAVDFICANFPDNTYWIEKSWRGYSKLCTNLPLFQDMYLTIGTGQNTHIEYACSFIKGRPDDRR